MTDRHLYFQISGAADGAESDVYGSFDEIATQLSSEPDDFERIEISFARNQADTKAPPPRKPKRTFYYDTHLAGSDGDGSEHAPWPDVTAAMRGLAEMQSDGSLSVDAGESVVIQRHEIFTASTLEKRKRRIQAFAKFVFMLMAVGLVLPVVAILGYLSYMSIPAFFPGTVEVAASDVGATGVSVRKFLDQAGESPDVVKGVGVVRIEDTNGTWEYYSTSDKAWKSFASSGVSTSRKDDSNAVVLRNTGRIRFVPNDGDEPSGEIEVRRWYDLETAEHKLENGASNIDVSTSWYEFITLNPKNRMTAGGIWAPFIGTFFLVLVSLLVSAPIGILAGVYLNEYAADSWFTRIINLAVVNLAGVPSIVHALFGVGAFVIAARFGESLLAAGCTLAVMTLPVIITSTREALAAVPMSFRMACWNMGATKWQTIRTIVLPNSISGILTGVILQVSRAAGETAPILFTGAAFYMSVADHGPGYWVPYGLYDKIMALAMHLFTVMTQVNNAPQGVIYGTAVVLIGLVLAVNSFAIFLRMYLRSRKKW